MSSSYRFDSLDDWLVWQQQLHSKEIDLGLDRVSKVWKKLNVDISGIRFITVAGTNGKGSTVAFLSAIYQAAGYRVGQYTSPHFLHYNERIQVAGEQASDQAIIDAFARIDQLRGDISLSFFEFGVLAALLIMVSSKVEVALLEVGLGGRLDAVNIIDADCAVISSISIDHRDWLGDTREAIGFEKAGIYRAERPAICGDLDIPSSVVDHAQQLGCHWYARGADFTLDRQGESWSFITPEQRLEGLPYPAYLLADVQLDNAATALMAVSSLQSVLPVAHQALCDGVLNASVPGRFQLLSESPQVILDVAHNDDAAEAVVNTLLARYPDARIHIVLGMLEDKEVQATVAQLDHLQGAYFLATPDSPRALSAEALAQVTGQGRVCGSVSEAFDKALQHSDAQDVILVTGSFFTVAEVMASGSDLS